MKCSQSYNKVARTTSTVSLFLTLMLTLHILVSLLSTLNIFLILHEVENAKIHDLYWKKRKKMEFGRLEIEKSVSPPECKPFLVYKPPPSYPKY